MHDAPCGTAAGAVPNGDEGAPSGAPSGAAAKADAGAEAAVPKAEAGAAAGAPNDGVVAATGGADAGAAFSWSCLMKVMMRSRCLSFQLRLVLNRCIASCFKFF